MKLDPVVKKENLYMILGCALCTVVVQLGIWAVGKYDLTVLLGGIWGFVVTELNFFIMTLAIQKAMTLGDEAQAKQKVQASYTLRMLLLIALIILGVALPMVHWLPVLVSVFYPRVVITVRGLIMGRRSKNEVGRPYDPSEDEEDREEGVERMMGYFGKKAAANLTTTPAADQKSEPADSTATKEGK